MLRVVVELAGEIVHDGVFQQQLLSLGRDPASDIVLEDPFVSSQHVVIKRDDEAGDFRLLDQSQNGIFCEGQRIKTLRFAHPVIVKIADFQVTLIPISARGGTTEAPVVDLYAPTVTDAPIPAVDEMLTTPHQKESTEPVVLKEAELRSISREGELKSLVFQNAALVGRSSECDLQFSSRDISRRHCLISAGTSSYVLRRLSTRNGVEANGRSLSVGEVMPLRDGDVIRLCDEEIVFLYPATQPKEAGGHVLLEAAPNLDLVVSRRGCFDESVVAVDVIGFLGVKTVNKFEDQMKEEMKSASRILVDLGYLVGVDKAGLSSLGRVISEAEQNGVAIQLIRLTPRLSDILSYSPLQRVVGRYLSNSEDTAVRKLRA